MEEKTLNRKSAPLLDDYIFKRTFTRDDPNGILRDLLESILKIKIRNVLVLKSEIPKDLLDEKASRLDIRAEIDNERIINIEMQVKYQSDIEKRSTLYMSKNISTQIKIAEKYGLLKPSIVINILNFNRYRRNSYHSVAHMKFEKTSKEEYVDLGYNPEEETATDVLEMHFIELPKFIKKNPEAKTKLEQWLWLIAGREDKIKMSKLDNPEVKKAMKLVEEVLSDPVEREILDAREMARLNYNSEMDYMREKGLNEGRKKRDRRTEEKNGRKERTNRTDEQNGQKEIAKKLKDKGMKIQEILEITGLSEVEINRL